MDVLLNGNLIPDATPTGGPGVSAINLQGGWSASRKAGVVSLSQAVASPISGGPPNSPNDGDIWVATNIDTNGTVWQFRYNAGSAHPEKWEFVGGGIMLFPTNDPNVLLNALTSTGSTQGLGWTIFYHSGSTLTLARAGIYAVSGSYNLFTTGAASITLGPSWTSDIAGNHWVSDFVSASSWTGVDFADTLISVSANDTVRLGLASSAPGNVTVRWNAGGITPVRIA